MSAVACVLMLSLSVSVVACFSPIGSFLTIFVIMANSSIDEAKSWEPFLFEGDP